MRQPQGADEAQAPALAASLADALRLPPLLGRLLVNRGLTQPADAHAFLHPKLSHLDDPANLPGARRAAQRIAQAIRERQPIVIYGDYDVDGVTASAILWHTLRFAGAEVSTYVPHRLEEGYGLNADAITELARPADGRTPLIVSVDCGITATEPARVARELGVDLIITDHHQFDPDRLPEAHTLVHPELPCNEGGAAASEVAASEHAPQGALCGAGVAFKLAWQVARAHCGSDRLPESFRDLLMDLLSLVALGTVADVVPLVGENRVLTIFGLGRIKHTRFIGLNALIDAAHLRAEKIEAYHVGFVLGPRLNACGRMGHAKLAVELLTEADEPRAAELAEFLTRENERRRATERAIFEEARQLVLEHGYDRDDCRAIVVEGPGWHPGVIGIVASRLVEQFSRPVVMLAVDDGRAHGSARSVEGVSIHDALHACADLLDRFGGHAMAAGLALASERVEAFRAALVEHVNARLSPEDLAALVEIDAELSLADCDLPLFEQIARLAPFGRGNPTPRLLLRDVTVDRPPQRVGRQGAHLSLTLRGDGRVMRAIGFGFGDLAEQLQPGDRLDVVFEPKVSTWQGRRRVDLHLTDLRPVEPAAGEGDGEPMVEACDTAEAGVEGGER